MDKPDRSQCNYSLSGAVFWLLPAILMIMLACSVGGVTQSNPTEHPTLPAVIEKTTRPTMAPSAKKTKASPGKEETFRDSFEAKNGWEEVNKGRYTSGLVEGEVYQISFLKAGDKDYVISLQPHEYSVPLKNMVLRVWGDALNKNGALGLVCRYQDPDNFYAFRIATDGQYWLDKYVQGKLTNLGKGNNDAITEENTLNLECIDKHISASVNDKVIIEINDSSLAEGNAGLFAQPMGGPLQGKKSYQAIFDSFEMTVQP